MLNKLISKIGLDKITHFAFGGLITAVIYILATGIATYNFLESLGLLGFILLFIFVISVIKEFHDTKFDWYDIIAALIGSLLVSLISILGFIF